MKSEEMSLWIAVSPKYEPFGILNMHVTHSTAELFQKRKYLKKNRLPLSLAKPCSSIYISKGRKG